MTRKRIELERGAVLPVARGLWDLAAEKLGESEMAIAAMQAAANRIAFEAGWGQFVDAIEQFWTRFYDEGKATFPAFQPWAGALDRERKADETLRYVFQARHQSQHGRIPMSWGEPQLIMGRGFAGRMYGLRVFPDQTYEADAVPDNPHSQEFRVEHAPGKALLPTIENKKYGQAYPPPSIHLGNPITDRSPIGVAQTVLAYYRDILRAALKQFQQGVSDA